MNRKEQHLLCRWFGSDQSRIEKASSTFRRDSSNGIVAAWVQGSELNVLSALLCLCDLCEQLELYFHYSAGATWGANGTWP